MPNLNVNSSLHCSCWIEDDPSSMWILTVPVSLSLVASLCSLVYVVRVLVNKLNLNIPPQPPMAFRKAVRATLILFPLFGLQHILLPLRPDPGTSEKWYQIFSAVIISCQVNRECVNPASQPKPVLMNSFQGLCVSFLFCFANQEVIGCVRAFLHQLFPRIIVADRWKSVNGPPPTQSRDVVV